jgi:hypothetical protein
MDMISLILFVAVSILIIAMIRLDLSIYKYHFLFSIIVLGVIIYTYGMLYQVVDPNYLDVVLKAFGNTSQILRGIFRTNEIIDRVNNDLLFLISAYAIHVIGFGYTYILIFAIFFKNLNLRMRFALQKNVPHFLVLGDDDRIKFVLESYEKDYLEKNFRERKTLKKVNIALPKTLMASKEVKTVYAFKPGVVSFDLQNQDIKNLLSSKQKDITIVSLLTKDQDVLALVEQLNTFYKANPNSTLKAYILFDQQDHLLVYESFNRQHTLVQFFSYHQIIAQQLMLDHPLTSILPESLIDFNKATLKPSKIGYHLVGFDFTNQEIYKHLFITNQFPPAHSKFLGKDLISYETKPIHYFIYDDKGQEFLNSFSLQIPKNLKKEYLPYPPLSATTSFVNTKLVGNQIIDHIHQGKSNTFDYQIFIIALGDDVLNLTMLQKVKDLITQQRLHMTTKIFVQIKNKEFVAGSSLFKESYIVPFGFGDYAFSLRQIVNPIFNKIAKRIHETYDVNTPFEALPTKLKESLLYEAISLRFKLNLMGLDMAIDHKGITQEDFYKRYDSEGIYNSKKQHLKAKNDADLQSYKQLVAKKKRNLLARQEHLRWSAYQLVQGITPLSIPELLESRNYIDSKNKKDARLTSFEALFDLHEVLVKQAAFKFSDADVIYPFFHSMDHLFDVIEGTPYKVIDVINRENNKTVELRLDDITSEIKSTIKE